jgi:transposase InsO family protein
VRESLGTQVREEVLDGELFTSVREARALLAHDRHHSNTMRAHGSLGYLTPAEFCELDVAIQRHILAALARLGSTTRSR